MAEGQDRRSGACHQEHRNRRRAVAPAGEDSLFRARRGRHQGGDCRLQEEAGRGEGCEARRRTRATECIGANADGIRDRGSGIRRHKRRVRLVGSGFSRTKGTMIEISETAAKKIRSLMAKQGITEGGLRVGVKGGGCSGLSYTFAWEREPRLGDEVFEGPEGAKIFVDRKSYLFLNGTTLDYDTALLTQGFVFHNPNAKQTCGCGSSFGA